MPNIGQDGTLFQIKNKCMIEQTSKTIYHRDADAYGVQQAAKDKEMLAEMGITSPSISKMHSLNVDRKTTMYFKTKKKRDAFIAKYFDKRTNKYSFIKKEDETNNNQ